MKIRPVTAESCFMRTDGQIDMTKLVVAFRNFANAPKNASCYLQIIALSTYTFKPSITVAEMRFFEEAGTKF